MKKSKKCSIIIRTRNEERWISLCLESVFNQDYDNFEVILVDNESSDMTMEKATKFSLKKIVSISKYRPGAALNEGIRQSDGEYIVCLSGHCIPTKKTWLSTLVATLEESDNFAGVYGRQEPMSFSSPADKRDLTLVFGLDRKIQSNDSFFHNANSILRKDVWEEVPFDEDVTNIEDRVWGQDMIRRGYNLVYEPKASVYHYHGIHQDGDIERCQNVVKIIEKMNGVENSFTTFSPQNMKILAIIPHRGNDYFIGNKSQLGLAVDSAISCKNINRVIVSTDSQKAAETARQHGAETPFIRSQELTREYIGTEAVVAHALQQLEQSKIFSDLVVYLEPTFPFRPYRLLDAMIEQLLKSGLDTLIAGKRESAAVWHEESPGKYVRVDSGDVPRIYKENLYISQKGIGLVTHPDCIRKGSLYGLRIGVYPIEDPITSIEVRDDLSRKVANSLFGFIPSVS